MYTFTYQKTLLHTLLLIVLKIVESLQCILVGTISAPKNVKVAQYLFLKKLNVANEILGQVEKPSFSVRCKTCVTSSGFKIS